MSPRSLLVITAAAAALAKPADATPADALVVCTPSYAVAAAQNTVSFSPQTLAVGDFNLDGKLDITATRLGFGVPILLGDGAGGFSPAAGSPAATGFGSYSVVVRDFNQDGKPDLAVSIGGSSANHPPNSLDILLGDGNGRFAAGPGSPILVPVGSTPFPASSFGSPVVAGGDFNSDGLADLAVLTRNPAEVLMAVLLGNGAGGFAAAPGSPFNAGPGAYSFIGVADFNLDGKADVVLASDASTVTSTTLRLGDGSGGFGPRIVIDPGTGPVLGDFNGDGKMDLALAVPAASGISPDVLIRVGDGSGAFSLASGSQVAAAGIPRGSGDFNGDGKLDLLVTRSGTLTILTGDGAGGLATGPSGIGPSVSPRFVVVDDFNKDGRTDIVELGTSGTYDLVSLINNCDATPSSTAMVSSPNPSNPGQSVTLTATVSPASGSLTPGGTVRFRHEASDLGSPVPLSGGVATLTTTQLNDGERTLTAVYSGSASFRSSTSPPVTHTVRPRVTLNDASANSASATALTFTASLSAPSNQAIAMEYATSDRSARAGVNYTATSGTLTFDAGQSNKTIAVTIPQGTPGPSKDFFLTLSNLVNATLSRATGIGTINYSAPGDLTLVIGDPSQKEGHTGSTLLGFTVSLSRSSPTAVTVDYATADGTAAAGLDYIARSGTLTFSPGKTSRSILVPVSGNTVTGSNRTLFVNLTNVTGGTQAAKSQGTGTILDDDPPAATTGLAQLRLYSPVTFEHLYTTDTNEYAVLPTRGWRPEGTAYTIFSDAGTYNGAFTQPIYRLYHAGVLQHHWTTDENEVTILAAGAWDYEGIAGFILPTQAAGTIPLYRLALPRTALHVWTTDENEKNVLSTLRGWTYEGIAGYVVP